MTLEGKIIFELANVGSKSEGRVPFIVTEDGKKVKVLKKNTNPFMNNPFLEYEGKQVKLDGEMNDNGTFLVDFIWEIMTILGEIVEEPDEDEDETYFVGESSFRTTDSSDFEDK